MAEPEAGTTFSLYANDHGMTQWSISMPVVCFCHLSQMDMELPLPPYPPPPTSEMKKKKKRTVTGGLQPLDIPGGSQEVAPQQQEDGNKGDDGDEDPGDDDGGHSDYSDHLEEDLGQTERRSVITSRSEGVTHSNFSRVADRLHSEGSLLKLNKLACVSFSFLFFPAILSGETRRRVSRLRVAEVA